METIQWIGDVVAICMCAATVLLMVRQSIRYRHGMPVRGITGIIGNFNQELRQCIGSGREPLVTLDKLEESESGNPENAINNDDQGALALSDPSQHSHQGQEGTRDVAVPASVDRYGEVKKLAGMGLDQQEIFERVRLPKGEIELVLKLSRLTFGHGENVRPGRPLSVSSM